jgi:hypothetical protein
VAGLRAGSTAAGSWRTIELETLGALHGCFQSASSGDQQHIASQPSPTCQQEACILPRLLARHATRFRSGRLLFLFAANRLRPRSLGFIFGPSAPNRLGPPVISKQRLMVPLAKTAV